jgi:hypothetical protein
MPDNSILNLFSIASLSLNKEEDLPQDLRSFD